MFADTLSIVVKHILLHKGHHGVGKHQMSRTKEVTDYRASLRIECVIDCLKARKLRHPCIMSVGIFSNFKFHSMAGILMHISNEILPSGTLPS